MDVDNEDSLDYPPSVASSDTPMVSASPAPSKKVSTQKSSKFPIQKTKKLPPIFPLFAAKGKRSQSEDHNILDDIFGQIPKEEVLFLLIHINPQIA